MDRLLSNKDVKKIINDRYSTKVFNPNKKVSSEDIQTIKEIFQSAPSSINSQPWKLLIVSNPELKEKIAMAALDFNQQKIRDCSHILVFLRRNIDVSIVDEISDINLHIRKVPKEIVDASKEFYAAAISSKKEKLVYWINNQVYLNYGFMISQLGTMGIDSCPIEGFIHLACDEALELKSSEYNSLLLLAIGYSAEDDMNVPSKTAKARFDMNRVVQEFK